jgi:hypothetical protein
VLDFVEFAPGTERQHRRDFLVIPEGSMRYREVTVVHAQGVADIF